MKNSITTTKTTTDSNGIKHTTTTVTPLVDSTTLKDCEGIEQTLTVGMTVGHKADIEQSSEIIRIELDRWGEPRVFILAYEGEYADSKNGTEMQIDAGEFYI